MKKIFVFYVLFLLVVPLGYIFGLHAGTPKGVEVVTELPSLQTSSYKKRCFQEQFEKWWQSHFYGRKTALKIKNQIYDMANFGVIHAGYNYNIIEGENGNLFERIYLSSFQKNCPKLPAQIENLKSFYQKAKEKNIDVYVVLAPNKAVTYSSCFPKRYQYFLGEYCKTYEKISNYLYQNKMPFFNVQELFLNDKSKMSIEPFSKTGTHWNHYGAGYALIKMAEKFGWGSIFMESVEKSKKPYTKERDIAGLLNLPVKILKNEEFYKPVLKANKSFTFQTSLIGNSFSNELKDALLSSGLAPSSQIIHYENRPLSRRDLKNIWKSRQIIFVYTDLSFFDENDQMYKKLKILLESQ